MASASSIQRAAFWCRFRDQQYVAIRFARRTSRSCRRAIWSLRRQTSRCRAAQLQIGSRGHRPRSPRIQKSMSSSWPKQCRLWVRSFNSTLPAPPIGAQEAPPVDGDGAEGEATAAKPKGLKGRALWEAHLAKGRPLTRDDVPRLGIHALSVYLRAMGETVSRTMLADVELLRKTALEALAARGVTEWCKGQGGQ